MIETIVIATITLFYFFALIVMERSHKAARKSRSDLDRAIISYVVNIEKRVRELELQVRHKERV